MEDFLEQVDTFIEQLGIFISPSNWSTITFDDLEHPRLVAIYSIYWDVSLFLTTVFFCFMLFMIITKSSTEMSGYKWYLVHQLTWSYLFDAYLSIWKPVPLWPFYIGYSAGAFFEFAEYASVVQLIGLTVVAIGMGFSIYVSLFHRYVQVSPFSRFHGIYSKLRYRIPTYAYILTILVGVICVPLALHLPVPGELRESLTSKYTVIEKIYKIHGSIFGFDPVESKYGPVLFIFAIIVVLIIVVLSMVFLYFNFIRILHKNKNLISKATLNMQLVLFRTLCVQVLLAGVLLVLPITSCMILLLFGVPWLSSFALFAIALLGTHAIADFIILTLFIKSYRVYIRELWLKLRKLIGFPASEQVANIVNASTTLTSGYT